MSETPWKIIVSDEAKADIRSLDGSQREEVFRSIKKSVRILCPTPKAAMASRSEIKAAAI